MRLLIKFPTRERSDKFLKVLKIYYDLLDDKNTCFIISCDEDDESMKSEKVIKELSNYKNLKIFYSNNKSKIEAVNNNLNDVDFDVVLLASDDMIPKIKGFDTIIKEKMLTHYPDFDGVLWFNDGLQKNKLNTLCILGKKYYDRFGYIYYPEYLSTWCDNEFMDVANLLNKQTYFDKIIIRHEHPYIGFGKQDYAHTMNHINDNHDRELYEKRKKINFNL